MKLRYGLFIALLALAACTNEDHASRALRGAGYTGVVFTGWSAFSCAESDQFATGFKATGPNGQQVSGTVCSGLLKGATIRTD